MFKILKACNTTSCDCDGIKGAPGHQGPPGVKGPEGEFNCDKFYTDKCIFFERF